VATHTVRSHSVGLFVSGATLGISTYLLILVLTSQPILAALVVVGAVATFLFIIPAFRMAFVVIGGLLTLQTSSLLTTPKMLYLGGVVLAAAIALCSLRDSKQSSLHRSIRPLLSVSVLFSALCATAVVVSVFNGTPAVSWLRDLAPYALFALVPLLALDLAPRISIGQITVLLLVASLLAALSFGIEWLGATRRDIAVLPITRVVLPSFFLAAAGFAYAVSRALGKPNFIRWSLLSSVFSSMIAVTGARSVVALAVSPLASGVALRSSIGRRWIRFVVPWLLFSFVILAIATGITGADRARIADRFQSLPMLLTDPYSDVSLIERSRQTAAAWDAFQNTPIVGVGLGAQFEWLDAFGASKVSSEIDTPLAFPAKFGLLGVTCLLACALVVVSWIRSLRRVEGKAVSGVALVGYLSIIGVWLLLGSPFEDKGLSLGFLLLLCMTTRELAAEASGYQEAQTPTAADRNLSRSKEPVSARIAIR
jgi:hypothetical protein